MFVQLGTSLPGVGFCLSRLAERGAGKEYGEKTGINMMDIEKNGENFGIKKRKRRKKWYQI